MATPPTPVVSTNGGAWRAPPLPAGTRGAADAQSLEPAPPVQTYSSRRLIFVVLSFYGHQLGQCFSEMPGSMFCEMDRGSGGFEEQRALQLAFELSMLSTGGFSDSSSPPATSVEQDAPVLPTPFIVPEESRNKKSQNMTECVPVPSSEHVAEIVGRQGCKIKALRAKTNTYIKTPVRGEEPVFVVTGRKEDVAKAKREILSAAEHFSQIRASRKNNLSGSGSLSPPGPPANVPGHVTIQVRVPYRVVGLVVGPKGATIKRIQHQTHTYIVTPSRDKEPVFDVTGLPESVEAAKREIEAHIAVRTGAGSMPDSLFQDTLFNPDSSTLLNSVYKSGFSSLFGYGLDSDTVVFPSTLSGSSGCSSASSSSSASGTTGLADLGSIWGTSLDRDEGLGDSPSFDTATASSSIWSFSARPSPPHSASPTDSLIGKHRDCHVCGIGEVTAALVPCGHNLFCYDCATRLTTGPDSTCPVCHQTVLQAIRILNSS
ncbi:RNA-binding protein MEX3B-like [Macrosteles quadrilineatus]|uniref:RNA-binding protein MEX3B-like n=1 Tax=Macrosteles quadrilineatus TaxID=74068 RepID=UPI0023E0E0E4|nr:RNA-binding protein MEX3B-like [Macrosteles quadrilineatus]